MTKKTIRAEVERIVPLTSSITQITLNPEEYIEYQAGQYLNIVLNNELISFSIANAPLGSRKYELHIRHSFNNNLNQALFAQIKAQGFVDIRLPFGHCSLDKLAPKSPIIFIAGGTGFAPVNAMIEQLLTNDEPRPFELFWGARSQSDLYLNEKVKTWENHVPHFHYYALVSEEKTAKDKQSLSSLVLKQHAQDLKDWQIVISGPFNMVYAVRDALVEQGISEKQLYSDAL